MRRRWLGIVGVGLGTLLLTGACKSSTTASAEPSASVTPWVVVSAGSATPSPTPSYSYSASPFPSGFLPLPSTSATPTPTGSATCPPNKTNVIDGADAVTGTTTATVSWFNPGGSDLVQYRVTAISQDPKLGTQRDVGWTVVTPGTPCATMSATVTGLDKDTDYVFSVDAVRTRLGSDGTWDKTVARSQVVSTKA